MSAPASIGRSIAVVAGSALAVAAVDQATKHLAEQRLARDQPQRGPLGVPLMRVDNDRPLGAASPALAAALTAGGVAIAAGWLGAGILIRRPAPAQVGAGMIAGGMLSNLTDRARHGTVTDMVPTPLGVVNGADLMLGAGVAMFAAGMVLRR